MKKNTALRQEAGDVTLDACVVNLGLLVFRGTQKLHSPVAIAAHTFHTPHTQINENIVTRLYILQKRENPQSCTKNILAE